MKIIELTGVPGSGKTLAAGLIKKKFSGTGAGIYEYNDLIELYFTKKTILNLVVSIVFGVFRIKLSRKLFYMLKIHKKLQRLFIHQNTQKCRTVKDLINKTQKQSPHADMIYNWYLQTGAVYTMASGLLGDDDYLLLSEGFFHKVQNIFVTAVKGSITEEDVVKYIKTLPEIHTLIAVKENFDRCIEMHTSAVRLKRHLGEPIENRRQFIKNSKIVNDMALDAYQNSGRSITELDNTEESDDPDDVNQNLSRKLENLPVLK